MSALLRYRPEIDGLRALAVLSVIIFHFNPLWLSGGYTGVDVFFVLSGFLITSIMAKEQILGNFSYKAFYVRRMKRILPPLYLVLLASVLVGFLILVPNDFAYLSKSIERIIFFLSNIHFAHVGDYFAPSANEMPLLHTWSLAVEEQFYFIWPLIFILGFPKRKYVRLIGFAILMLGSFVLGEVILRNPDARSFAYFSLATRFGELLIGALAAILMVDSRNPLKVSFRKSVVFCFIGLVLVLFSFFSLSEESKFPGFNAISSTLGAALLIVGMAESNVFTKFFSWAPLVHIGKLSYSLYLWHWPMLAYMRYMFGQNELPISWLAVAALLTYGLSFISYSFVETPTRKTNFGFGKAFLIFFAAPTIFLLVTLKVVESSLQREMKPLYVKYGGDEICHGRQVGECLRGDLQKKAKIIVFGDSHTAHLNYFLDELGKLNGWSAVVRSASSCGPAFGFDVNYLADFSRPECVKLINYVKTNYKHFDTIVIAARWEYHLGFDEKDKSDPDFLRKFEETLVELIKAGKKVYLVSQIPLLTKNPHRAERILRYGIPIEAVYNQDYQSANGIVAELAKKYNVHWLDISSLLEALPGGIYLNGSTVYMDDNHLSQFGANALANLYFKSENKLQP